MFQHFTDRIGVALTVIAASAFTTGCTSTSITEYTPTGPTPIEPWSDMTFLAHDGDIYFASQPDPQAFQEAQEAGVTTVVNLRYPEELESLNFNEVETIDGLGMKYVNIPISPDTFSAEDVDRLADVLDHTSDPVLIHCSSSNRVGGLWAAYLHQYHSLPADEAMVAGRQAGLRSESMTEATLQVIETP